MESTGLIALPKPEFCIYTHGILPIRARVRVRIRVRVRVRVRVVRMEYFLQSGPRLFTLEWLELGQCEGCNARVAMRG